MWVLGGWHLLLEDSLASIICVCNDGYVPAGLTQPICWCSWSDLPLYSHEWTTEPRNFFRSIGKNISRPPRLIASVEERFCIGARKKRAREGSWGGGGEEAAGGGDAPQAPANTRYQGIGVIVAWVLQSLGSLRSLWSRYTLYIIRALIPLVQKSVTYIHMYVHMFRFGCF